MNFDPNWEDSLRKTAIFYAVTSSNTNLINLLVKAGACVDHLNKNG